ncbi:isochorismatase family protein [Prosthecomicrobium sp. N25]|uniref:isochorismatase family protein n=1 Tax=Prosthecomicrobium sp. N25 TaxID=3129254 RepID=UPI003076A1D7
MARREDFEEHCWKDTIDADTLKVYSAYARETFVGPNPAVIAIDLYNSAYRGGPRPPVELQAEFPSSCGINAWAALEPTRRLFAAARLAGVPIFYCTSETRPQSRPSIRVNATRRQRTTSFPDDFVIHPELAPAPEDVVITKQRASIFAGTPLVSHLTVLGVRSLIVCGESTSGCVRASCVDGYSSGYHVTLVEECTFDRSDLIHKVNLFDLHHKYADVMKVDEVIGHLGGLAGHRAAAE